MNLNSNHDTTPKEPENAKLYVGNLPFSVDDNSLKAFFEEALGPDTVLSSQVVMDRERGRSKGFGFVAFKSPELAQKAATLSGQEITAPDGNKRPISIDQAHERKPRTDGGNRGNFSRGGDYGSNRRFGNSGGNSSWSGGGGGYNRDRGGDRQYSSGSSGRSESSGGNYNGGGNYGGGSNYSGGSYKPEGENFGGNNNYGGGNFGANNFGGGENSFGGGNAGGARKPGSKGSGGGFKKKSEEKDDDWWT